LYGAPAAFLMYGGTLILFIFTISVRLKVNVCKHQNITLH